MLGAMHGACATHMPDALHERTNELTNADLASNSDETGSVGNAGARPHGRSDFDHLPKRRSGHTARSCQAGYVYVIEFSFGVIKVGQTTDPRARLRQHHADASKFLGHITRYWLSPEHDKWLSSERALIAECATYGQKLQAEYFAGCAFESAVFFAEGLDFTPWTASSPLMSPGASEDQLRFDMWQMANGALSRVLLPSRSLR